VQSWTFVHGFVAGVVVYLTHFVSFSLLPLCAFFLALIVLVVWKQSSVEGLKQMGVVLGGFLLGLLFTYLLFQLLFSYDPFYRYQFAMQSHRTQKNFQPGFIQVLASIPQNLIEFIFWVGVPLVFLTLSRWGRATFRYFSRSDTNSDLFALAFLGLFSGLVLLGQTRGEVGRIWIYLVPVFVILAVVEISYLYKRYSHVFYVLLSSELITTYLLYKFHDRV
jgi:hypothetical protein